MHENVFSRYDRGFVGPKPSGLVHGKGGSVDAPSAGVISSAQQLDLYRFNAEQSRPSGKLRPETGRDQRWMMSAPL